MGDRRKGTCESLQAPILVKDIGSCIKTLNKTQQCIYRSHYEDVIKEGRYQVLSVIRQIKEQNCRKPSLPPKEDIERDIFMAEMESEFEETKIDHVRKEWTQQQNAMAKLQEHLYKKCRLLSLHSSYSTTQGSALCAILAVLMENQELVEAYLSEPDTYLIKFIKIADGCLFSFVKTYAFDNPLEESTDYKYILALYTCIVHISNSPRGRQFLIQREECQNMLSEITYIIPHIKYSIAKDLQIILLKILHNLTKEADGTEFLRGCSDIFSTLDNCISMEYDPETHQYALELLECITQEIPTKECLEKITKLINTQRLKELSGQMFKEVKHIPRKIFQNIRIAADKIIAREQEQAQGDVLRSKSADNVCKCKSKKSLEIEGNRSVPSSGAISSQQKIHTPQDDRMTEKMTPTRDVCTPLSTQSSSFYASTTEFSESTSCPPSRETPQRRSRPVSQTSRSMSSHKPVTLCTSPCRYLFPDSPCMCRPHSSEHSTKIPIRKTCIPSCGGRRKMQEKRPVSPFESSISSNVSKSKRTGSSSSGYRPLCDRPSSSSRPSSPCERPCSVARPSSGSRPSSSGYRPPCHKPSSGMTQSSGSKPSCSGYRPSSGVRPSSSSRPSSLCDKPCSVTKPSSGSRPSSSGYKPPCHKPSSGVKRSSSRKPPSRDKPCSSCNKPSDRPSSGNILYKIKDKVVELASSASKTIRNLVQKTPDVPSCGTATCNDKPPCSIKKSKSSFNANKKTKIPSKLACVSTSKSKNKSAIPVFYDRPTSRNRLSSGNKKTSCPCKSSSKHKKTVKSPFGKPSRICAPTCKGSCKYKKRKVSGAPSNNAPNRCSCVSSKTNSTSECKPNKPSSSESKVGANMLKSEAKQTSSDLECKKPTRMVCTDRFSSPDVKNAVSFSKSIESKASSEHPTPYVKQTINSESKDVIKSAACAPACTPSLGNANANTPSPANSSPAINTGEEEICTCGSISERRLVPWTPENRMVARLGEIDRRVCHRVQNTVRIVSRLDHVTLTGRTQRVVTRIKIPGLRFQRVMDPERKGE